MSIYTLAIRGAQGNGKVGGKSFDVDKTFISSILDESDYSFSGGERLIIENPKIQVATSQNKVKAYITDTKEQADSFLANLAAYIPSEVILLYTISKPASASFHGNLFGKEWDGLIILLHLFIPAAMYLIAVHDFGLNDDTKEKRWSLPLSWLTLWHIVAAEIAFHFWVGAIDNVPVNTSPESVIPLGFASIVLGLIGGAIDPKPKK